MTDISKSNIKIDLPPLSALPAFEAAARFGSFSKAAQELNSSQPAISQQIRHLERAVGQPLFRRKSQGVVVTEAGETLLAAVQLGFAALQDAMGRLRQPRERVDLTVATDFAFAAYWLLPRLERFKAEMPLVDVRILTAQHADDLGGASADIAVLFGANAPPSNRPAGRAGKRGGVSSIPDRILLFPERIFPVCAPAYARQARAGSPDWLAGSTLLHLDDVAAASHQPQRHGDRWFRWSDWFAGAGLRGPIHGPQLRFNNYTLVLQAAIAGQGVALGWTPLVEPLLAAGQLVPAHDFVLSSTRGYIAQLLRRDVPAGASRKPAAPTAAAEPESARHRFLDWLQREAILTGKSNVIQSSASTSSAPRPR